MRSLPSAALLVALAFGAAQAQEAETTSEPAEVARPEAAPVRDPFEPFNRSMFAFNAGVDRYALSPAATAYKTVTPRFARDRVGDVLDNLSEPVTFANEVLQGKPGRAAETIARFSVNTTLGLAGLWNPAQEFGLTREEEDFGQTLGVWGVGSGPFVVLPLLGPTTPRDFVGRGVDAAFDPLNYDSVVDEDTRTTIGATRGVLGGLNARVKFDDQIDALNSQVEPYIAIRQLYAAQREAAIRDGRVNEETAYDDLPDFDEIDE